MIKMNGKTYFLLLLTAVILIISIKAQAEEKNRISLCLDESNNSGSDYVVVNSYRHDVNAYTQGLYYKNGFLYESTGRHGESTLRKVELKTGKVVRHVNLPYRFYGEGIAAAGGKIYQLTWRSRTGFIYDEESFRQQGVFTYNSEGWGLASDEKYLVMSNGTDTLHFFMHPTLSLTKKLAVRDDSAPLHRINEMEFIEGFLYVNVWKSDRIYKISPKTGKVEAKYDMSGLLKKGRPGDPEGVLNGIAYDAFKKRIFVTGKLWPCLFEIRFKF